METRARASQGGTAPCGSHVHPESGPVSSVTRRREEAGRRPSEAARLRMIATPSVQKRFRIPGWANHRWLDSPDALRGSRQSGRSRGATPVFMQRRNLRNYQRMDVGGCKDYFRRSSRSQRVQARFRTAASRFPSWDMMPPITPATPETPPTARQTPAGTRAALRHAPHRRPGLDTRPPAWSFSIAAGPRSSADRRH